MRPVDTVSKAEVLETYAELYDIFDDYKEIKKELHKVYDKLNALSSVLIRCKDCKHCEHWYADKGRCFLWHEDGIGVFEDGYCNYAERRTDENNNSI